MIIKASQRSGATQLAHHLLSAENDHVTVHELRGFVSDNVLGAFKEIQAMAKPTRCQKFMFSLSLNPTPHEKASVDDFENAIKRIEVDLNLKDQPRAIVFHEKEGRRHCHVVYSRIDGFEMKAIKLPYFKKRLNGIAKELYLEHGWELPDGFISPTLTNPLNFTLAEWQQGKRHKVDPREIKSQLQACWQHSDNQASFAHALNEKGFFLAKGDRRGFVALDWRGEIYSLTRALAVKSKAIADKLGSPENLNSVDDTKAQIANDHIALHRRFAKELNLKHEFARKPLMDQRIVLKKQQQAVRNELKTAHEQRAQQEQQVRQQKIRKGLMGLWDLLTGKSKKQHQQNEQETALAEQRDKQEREKLITQQLEARRSLQAELQALRAEQAQEKQSLDQSFSETLKPFDLSL